VPLDWSLKTECKFTSQESFEWCSTVSMTNESLGVSEFVRCLDGKKDDPSRFQVDFKKALSYFVHPTCTLPTLFGQSCSAASAIPENQRNPEQQENAKFFANRQSEWSEGFRSLYYLLRSKLCPFFYFKCIHYTVLFVGNNVGGYKGYTAIMSRSTKSLRDQLREKSILFEMPLASKSEKVVDELKEENSAELKELRAKNVQTQSGKETITQISYDHVESILLFRGHQAVHSIYDFLLNGSYPDELPLLLSPVAFVNSAMKQVQIKSNGTFSKQMDGKMETLYCLELSGHILPCGVMQLCEVMKNAQKKFSASFKTLKNTIGMNFSQETNRTPSPSNSPAKPLMDHLSSSSSSMDQLQEPSGLDKHVIKKITCTNNEFIITPSRS